MRLNRLDLTRYGKFTGRSIDFGAPVAGKHDLHIVYGPNEAGKTTTLIAWLDLLFGIETRSRYNFLHPHETMRIGGSLEIDGTAHEVARIKRARGTLLDGNGQPIAESLLTSQLGTIDRDSYRAMFSLDDDTLEAGGESILASKGDLGELLFSASAGLADLSRVLTSLRAEADGFYRYHAHNTALTEYKRRLAELRDQREAIDTAATRYAALVEARDVARRQYDEAIAARAVIQSRKDAIQRQLGALPRLIALHALRAQLAPLCDLPMPPPGWTDTLPGLLEQATTLAVQHEGLARDLAETLAARDAIVVDEAALALSDKVARLADLQARDVTAAKDIPVRRQEVHEAEIAIGGILGRIGRARESDPARLVLPAARVGVLQDLIESRSGVETARSAAEAELQEARLRLAEAEADLLAAAPDGATVEPGHRAALAAAVAAVQQSDAAVRRRAAERSRDTHQAVLADRLVALRPWHGDVGQLSVLTVPDETDLHQWQAELTASQRQHDRREQEAERAQEEQARRKAACDAIIHGAGVVSDQEAAAIRAAREAAWAAHRRTLDVTSADTFEAAMRRDDLIADARLRHEADIARLRQAGEALARADADLLRAREEFTKAELRLHRIQGRIAAAAPFLPEATLDALKAWLGRRDKALATRADLLQAERDLRAADADIAALRQGLLEALRTAGLAHDPTAATDALRAVAQAVLDREDRVASLREAVRERQRDVQARERRLRSAAERDARWQADWAEACADCWLGEGAAPPPVGAVRQILQALADLAPALERRASLLDRIERMQADQADFAAAVATLVQALGWDAADATPLDLARRIDRRINQARTAMALHADKTRDADALRQRQHDLAETQRGHDARAREMTAFFSVETLSQVAARLADVARKQDLQRRMAEAARDILDALRVASIDEAEQVLADADRAALETELATLTPRFDDQDQRTRDLFAHYTQASDQVERVGGDAAAARIEEQRRTLLLDIEERATAYMRLRVGIAAAERALQSYRQQHRSDMMAQASDAFHMISRGAYRGLASQPNKDSEDLIALGADGSSKLAAQLSKGTRFQLYLALRYAGYREFARLRPPVPFIADDILETFDDDRAEQALRLLARIGEIGQAIYLTHHRHICDIARHVCPDARLHEL